MAPYKRGIHLFRMLSAHGFPGSFRRRLGLHWGSLAINYAPEDLDIYILKDSEPLLRVCG